jgi:hypothetical protein
VGRISEPTELIYEKLISEILSESFSWQKKNPGYQGGMVFGEIDFDFLANFFFQDIRGVKMHI